MKICYHCMQQIPNDKAHTCPQCGKSLEAVRQAERFLEPGTILGGKFLVGYPLGAGGFGNTYIGWDNLLFRKVAVKEFYPEQYCARSQDGKTVTVTDPKSEPRFRKGRQEFLEEARRVAALHEVRGVVEISNFFEENGTGYIVMEYLEGMDIRTILKKSGNKRDYEWSRRAILAVLYTLKEIHKRGVIHRDIAPDNIFVTKEGIIKLIDFGAAKYASAESTSDIMLKSGYAPIEQYSRKKDQGPYTDLYAVAALFYRMLTGQKPLAATERLKQDCLIPPSEMGISLPQQAEFAIMVCLNVMPQYRLQSAEDFMEALDGKYFIPVYEPEWILPSVEERKGIFGKFASFSAPVKAAVCFACICVVGAAVFGTAAAIRHAGAKTALTDAIDNREIVMQDFRGGSKEEAEAYIQKLNAEHSGWDIRLDTEDFIFDLTKENDTIADQSIAPGAVLYDPDKKTQGEGAEGLTYDDKGNLSGTVKLTLYSRKKIHYREICGLNAYALARKLEIDTTDVDCFIEEEKEGSNYFDLAFLETEGKRISSEKINEEENGEQVIPYSPDMKIYYYASDFFYWEKLPDFAAEYGSLDNIPEQTLYKYNNETDRAESGAGSLADSGLIDQSWYTLESDGHFAGKIIGQNKEPGKEYDGSQPGDEPLVIGVLGDVLDYRGKTAKEFIEEIARHGFQNYSVELSSGAAVPESDWGWNIENVEVRYKSDESEKLDYFSSEDSDVFFYIQVKEPIKPKPAQNPTPVPEPENIPEPVPELPHESLPELKIGDERRRTGM